MPIGQGYGGGMDPEMAAMQEIRRRQRFANRNVVDPGRMAMGARNAVNVTSGAQATPAAQGQGDPKASRIMAFLKSLIPQQAPKAPQMPSREAVGGILGEGARTMMDPRNSLLAQLLGLMGGGGGQSAQSRPRPKERPPTRSSDRKK